MTFTEGNTGTWPAHFTVILSKAGGQPVTLAYATAFGTATAGSDYQAASGALPFAPGEKTIAIEVDGDNKREADESFYLDLYGLGSNGLFTKNRNLASIQTDD